MRIAVCLLALVAAAGHAAPPVFMLDATPTDARALAVIAKYVTESDFVRLRDVVSDPALAAKVKPSQRFDDFRSLADVTAAVSRACIDKPAGHTIWYYSPTAGPEFRDSLGSVASALKVIHSQECLQAGISPSAEFWGYQGPCVYDLAASAYQRVDWKQVDSVMVRGEGWLKAGCVNGVAGYQKFMTTLTGYLRKQNPRIRVYAHVSLRYTPPEMMVDGIRALTSDVDGFSLAYPLFGEHVYCTPENLEIVLSTRSQSAR